MHAQELKKMATRAIEELALALDDGHSESLTAYLAAMGRFHRYSLCNTLLIASARPDATQVAGYRTWQRLGRQVRKGERGITILAPIRRQQAPREPAAPESAAGQPDSPRETAVSFRTATVFDIAQTEGDPLPPFATVQGNPAEYLERLEQFVAARGIALRRGTPPRGALGVSAGGIIVLRDDLAPAEAFSTLVHETAHELLHRDAARHGADRTLLETEAEAVAFVVCRGIGLETNTASADYIQLYDGTKDTLLTSLDRIRTTAIVILEALCPESSALAHAAPTNRGLSDACADA